DFLNLYSVRQTAGDCKDPLWRGSFDSNLNIVKREWIRIETIDADVEHAKRFLQSLRESTANGHHFADRFHLRPDSLLHSLKLLQIPPRNFANDIVEGGLKKCRGCFGNSISQVS